VKSPLKAQKCQKKEKTKIHSDQQTTHKHTHTHTHTHTLQAKQNKKTHLFTE
jgi:hypothetical protein